ncbi:MAG: hypothetical protein ACFFC7_30820 [Candidatus Hermodarchaeota archaeon]
MDQIDELPKVKPSRHFLSELIFNSVPLNRIAEITGRNIPYIRRRLKEYDLPTPREFKQTTLREMWKYRIAILYMRLNGMDTIAARTPFTDYVIKDVLHELGILTDLHLGSHIMKIRLDSGWQPLSPHLQQVLEGELLGDGTLAITRSGETSRPLPSDGVIINALDDLQWFSWVDIKPEPHKLDEAVSLFNNTRETLAYLHGATFQLCMASHATDWIDYVATQFRAGGYYVNINTTKWVDKNDVAHPMIGLRTESSLNLRREQLRWYGLFKGIPWDFELTPTSLLHWFMGDGSFGNEISFSTHCFHWNEVELLACQLRQKVDVKSKIDWRPSHPDRPTNPNRRWMVILPVDSASKTRFFDYLSLAPGFEVARKTMPWKFSKYIQKQDCV